MFVGVCRLSLSLRGVTSLKNKRSIVKRVVERSKQKFNASICEVDDNDLLSRATIGITVIGNQAGHVDSMLANIVSFVGRLEIAPVATIETEIIPMGSEFGMHLERDILFESDDGDLTGFSEEDEW